MNFFWNPINLDKISINLHKLLKLNDFLAIAIYGLS